MTPDFYSLPFRGLQPPAAQAKPTDAGAQPGASTAPASPEGQNPPLPPVTGATPNKATATGLAAGLKPPTKGEARPAPAPLKLDEVSYTRDPKDPHVIELHIRDIHNKEVGPFVVTISKQPSDADIASIQGALVQLIGMAHQACPDFDVLTFSGGLDSGRPAAAHLTKIGKDKHHQVTTLGGDKNEATRQRKLTGFPDDLASFIDAQLRVLKKQLIDDDCKLEISRRKSRRDAQQAA